MKQKVKKLYELCKAEIEKGGKYRGRIKASPLYKELRQEYKNIDDVIKKAEANDPILDDMQELYSRVAKRLGTDSRSAGLIRFEMLLEDKELVENFLYRYGNMAFKRLVSGNL